MWLHKKKELCMGEEEGASPSTLDCLTLDKSFCPFSFRWSCQGSDQMRIPLSSFPVLKLWLSKGIICWRLWMLNMKSNSAFTFSGMMAHFTHIKRSKEQKTKEKLLYWNAVFNAESVGDHRFPLDRRWGPLCPDSDIWPIACLVTGVLLEPSHIHSFTFCL